MMQVQYHETEGPFKVAGRYGVVRRGGHGSWEVAEVVGPTGIWIHYSPHAKREDAETEARAQHAKEHPSIEAVNFAAIQERVDKGQLFPIDCYVIGLSHRAYRGAHLVGSKRFPYESAAVPGLGCPASDQQRDAYLAGYFGEPYPFQETP